MTKCNCANNDHGECNCGKAENVQSGITATVTIDPVYSGQVDDPYTDGFQAVPWDALDEADKEKYKDVFERYHTKFSANQVGQVVALQEFDNDKEG